VTDQRRRFTAHGLNLDRHTVGPESRGLGNLSLGRLATLFGSSLQRKSERHNKLAAFDSAAGRMTP
jgi:hypothetical protein